MMLAPSSSYYYYHPKTEGKMTVEKSPAKKMIVDFLLTNQTVFRRFLSTNLGRRIPDSILPPQLLIEALQGSSGCVCSFGHSASGKSSTINFLPDSGKEHPGLVRKFGAALFEEVKHCDYAKRNKILVSLSVLEATNKGFRDLLDVKEARLPNLTCVLAHGNLGLSVIGASKLPCPSLEVFQEGLAYARQRLAINSMSSSPNSRKGSVIYEVGVQVQPYQAGTGRPVKISSVQFVDFACDDCLEQTTSPALATFDGDADKTAGAGGPGRAPLNRDLDALSQTLDNVSRVSKSEGGPPLPKHANLFGMSYLTQYLQEALAGQCRTTFIACVDPSLPQDSINTLGFVSKLRQIATWPCERSVAEGGFAQILSKLNTDLMNPQQKLVQLENAVRMGMRQEQDAAPARKEVQALMWQMEEVKRSYVADVEGRGTCYNWTVHFKGSLVSFQGLKFFVEEVVFVAFWSSCRGGGPGRSCSIEQRRSSSTWLLVGVV